MGDGMSICVTGTAGFIGHAVSKRLLRDGHEVIGIDNLNDYYPVHIKMFRLSELMMNTRFHFHKVSVQDDLENIFAVNQPEIVIHLAAQAGVRYSVTHPHVYIDSNIKGFLNILECCQRSRVEHLLYASSSSAKGLKSIYAISKYVNELMAANYQEVHSLKSTGMRFFSVYGPNGRPDMAISQFADKIKSNKPIDLYNHGECKRAFTYIDDVVEAIIQLMNGDCSPIIDIGNPESRTVNELVTIMENYLGKAEKNLLPMQAGDVLETHADLTELNKVGFMPKISLEEGIGRMFS